MKSKMKVVFFIIMLAVYYYAAVTFLSVHYRQQSIEARLNGIVAGRRQNYAARDSCYAVAERYNQKATNTLRWIGQ